MLWQNILFVRHLLWQCFEEFCRFCIILTMTWIPPSLLKAVDTISNCQRLAFTVGVSQHMHKITNLWKFELNRSSNLQDNNGRKNTVVTRSYVRLDGWFRDLKFSDTSSSKLVVSKSNSWKITSFSKAMALLREPFFTMFCTVNLSPLLVTKKGFMLIIILSNYQ